ncbi:SUMF1/EgtB/PvdO family nonheme iron enzyme [Candidatus Chloroploca sp. M-50]|uniref:SUMF1/EgtB/PvdO family nonheme iron enzyme n=1 Tax=Candidatus Chloroploca mongolica TaxID=2528176 RepID=A0ABS4D7T1_9CHLR|nr:SUMF1/EgtB/PvdO family nonheme iron enzyme [Candidatus Chloroploca mongolica]MBP1465495.1 SUMF1/EgtB/PvdO family nonheme iron enzyme [Candidatus Chloroploca mongolica]
MVAFAITALGPTHALFRGREAELVRLRHLCLDDVASYLVLYGGRQNGKTSLLLRLEAALQSDARVCRVDFQLIKGASAERAFAHLATRIAIPVGIAAAAGVQDGPTFQQFLTDALGRAEISRFVLMLDEWGALPAPTREALANALRSIFHTRLWEPTLEKLQVIFSGGVELYDLIITEASSLHNICEEVYLGDLGATEALALMQDGLKHLGLSEAVVADLGRATYERVNGHPYLTQRIGRTMVQALQPGVPLPANALADAIAEIQRGDPLLRRIRDDVREHHLEDAARRLLSDPPPFTRLDDAMARLELIGLAKPAGDIWATRNALLAEVFGPLLGVAPPRVVVPPDAVVVDPSISAADAGGATPPPEVVVHPSTSAPDAGGVTPPPEVVVHPSTSAAPPRGKATPSPLPAWVPPLSHIPAGPFLMGSSDADRMAEDREKPQHTLTLPDYWIGTTPVTNAQFRPFVEGDGYTNPAYWTKVGWAWREQEKIVTPQWWNDSPWNGARHPVVGVSWFEAVAYCRWLSAQIGHEFRLPPAAEWEKAARGREGRIWPWGNAWESGRCNSKKARHNRTTPVDQYPTGASPYGVLDMAGNVWEWCATLSSKGNPYQLEDEWQAAYLEADKGRIRRGGSWYHEQKYVRASCRSSYDPRNRDSNSGLRVVSHSPLPGSES